MHLLSGASNAVAVFGMFHVEHWEGSIVQCSTWNIADYSHPSGACQLELGRFPGMELNVDIPNAFIGRKDKPSPEDLDRALGPAAAIWKELVSRISSECGVVNQEWSSYSSKHGWFVKFKLKKRTIVYLSPCLNCFRVSFILGDRAVIAARDSKLSASLVKALQEAPRYPEGTGLRLLVKSQKDIPAILKLTRVKLAN